MKIIITYEGVSDADALIYVEKVVNKGRISKNETQYCYFTMFNNEAEVYADRTKVGTDTFLVRKHLPDTKEADDGR